MTNDPIASLARWRAVLGEDQVLDAAAAHDRYGPNVTEYRERALVAALLPATVADVERCVAVANEMRVPLYPVSTGRNWGVGSKLPVVDGCAVIDLHRMARIREIDAAGRVAVVEPGVTQGQLAAELARACPGLRCNVTGSGSATSVLGNTLERGVGVLGPRDRDLRAAEVVLGSGAVVRTGHWHVEGVASVHHPPGLGPDLTGLFLQSGFGIVTAIAVGLLPAEPVALVFAVVADDQLEAFVDEVGALRAAGVLDDRVEIDRDDDPRVTSLVAGEGGGRWVMWAHVGGSERMRAARCDEVAERLTPAVAALRVHPSPDEPDLSDAVRARFDLVRGIPTDYNILAMASAGGAGPAPAEVGDVDLDYETRVPGFVCALPAVPLRGDAVRAAARVIDEVSGAAGVQAFQSYNSVSASALEGYIRVVFDRGDRDAVASAHRWCDDVHEALRGAGFAPLRVDVDRMAAFAGGDSFWDTVADIKRALDPNGIISPGRYAPAAG